MNPAPSSMTFFQVIKKNTPLFLAVLGTILGTLAFHLVLFTCVLALFFFILHLLTALAAFKVLHTLPIMVVYGGTAALTIHGISIAVVSVKAVNREIDKRRA